MAISCIAAQAINRMTNTFYPDQQPWLRQRSNWSNSWMISLWGELEERLGAMWNATRKPGTNLSFCVTPSCFYCSDRCFITTCVCSFSGVCVSVIVWMTCLLWKALLVWETTEVLSDYLMYTQKELFEMNHMKEGTRHVYKIKYNYSITQIFWRELNKYPNEEMKPTYFFQRLKRMCAEECPWIRANIWDGKQSNITWPYCQKRKRLRRHRTCSCRRGDARLDVEKKKKGKISVRFSSNFGNKIKRCSGDTAPALRSISVWHCFMRRAAVVCCWQGTVWKVTGHITCVPARLSVNLYAIPFPAREESLLTRNYVTRWNKGMRSKQTLSSLEDFHCQNVLSLWVQSTSEAETTSSTTELTVKQTPVEKQSLCMVWLHFFVMFIRRWQTLFMCDSTRFSWPQCPDSTGPPPLFHLWTQKLYRHNW